MVTRSKTLPLGCGRRLTALAETSSFSCGEIGRCCVIELPTCTVPIAGNGNEPSVMIPMCSGNASMCG